MLPARFDVMSFSLPPFILLPLTYHFRTGCPFITRLSFITPPLKIHCPTMHMWSNQMWTITSVHLQLQGIHIRLPSRTLSPSTSYIDVVSFHWCPTLASSVSPTSSSHVHHIRINMLHAIVFRRLSVSFYQTFVFAITITQLSFIRRSFHFSRILIEVQLISFTETTTRFLENIFTYVILVKRTVPLLLHGRLTIYSQRVCPCLSTTSRAITIYYSLPLQARYFTTGSWHNVYHAAGNHTSCPISCWYWINYGYNSSNVSSPHTVHYW